MWLCEETDERMELCKKTDKRMRQYDEEERRKCEENGYLKGWSNQKVRLMRWMNAWQRISLGAISDVSEIRESFCKTQEMKFDGWYRSSKGKVKYIENHKHEREQQEDEQ